MTDTANSFAEWRVLAPTAPERPAEQFLKDCERRRDDDA